MLTTAFLVILLSGCSHYYYVPNVQNVPLFQEKNQYRFSGIVGVGDESTCIELQSAYSISNQIGVMANFMHASDKRSSGDNSSVNNSATGNYFEGALGYYKPLGKSGVFEVYGGLGMGGQHHRYASYFSESGSTDYGSSDLFLAKFFVQPSLGLTYDFFDLAFSTRLYSVNYLSVRDHTFGDSYISENLSALSSKSHFFLEPALTLRGGWKSVKVQFQLSIPGYLNSPRLYFYEEYHFSMGLFIFIAGSSKKKTFEKQ